ncbi:uncharacterized protein LOC113359482 [Papaver somniferum]|uniref:uncharacterized protein LOC113359482 n=1 Tax=Papaver somniferum TaxID=3469 RepID=UPI000E703B3F|nr:uncharacterized protein LOC113359482 [Papaver somniferum]
MVKQCHLVPQNQAQQIQQTWSPPQSNQLKINVDASLDHTSQCFGIGLIIRDSTGQCRGIRGKYINGRIDPEQAECLAMKEAILWARDCGSNNIILESDCANVINSIKTANPSVQWTNQGLVDEIRLMLSYSTYLSVNFVKRTAKNASHVIANESRTQRQSFTYLENFPDKFNIAIREDQKFVNLSYVLNFEL